MENKRKKTAIENLRSFEEMIRRIKPFVAEPTNVVRKHYPWRIPTGVPYGTRRQLFV
jgi:hypothetical protein